MGLLVAVLLAALVSVSGCGAFFDPRQAEADRVAQVVTDAISFPRQHSAAGYARAAADTTAARDGRLVVVEAREVRGRSREDPTARLAYRIHFPEEPAAGVWDLGSPALTVCYAVELDQDGALGPPRRRECPDRTSAVVLPPPPLVMKVPVGSDVALRRSLRGLPSGADDARVRAAVLASLPPAPAGSLAPEVVAATAGADAGVSVRGAAGDCVLGVRFGATGTVLVWRPAQVLMQPGELSCDPGTALHRGGITAPH